MAAIAAAAQPPGLASITAWGGKDIMQNARQPLVSVIIAPYNQVSTSLKAVLYI
jgi:hypothetical protein